MPRALITIVVITLLPWPAAIARVQAAAQDTAQEIQQAKSLIAEKKYEEAVKELKRLKKLQQAQDPGLDLLLAQAYQGLRAFKNAADSADAVLRAAGDNKILSAEAHDVKGMALMDLAEPGKEKDKHLKDAEEEFRTVLSLAPNALPIARYYLGVSLIRQGRDPEGIAELKTYMSHPASGTDLGSIRKMIAEPRRAREPFAPDFSLTTLGGEYISSDDLRGKVVMLDFWGTWCPPCVESVPTITDIEKRYASKPFQLISISSDENDEAWRSFIAKHKMTWAQYRDASQQVIITFDVNSYPTYVLIDHEGIIRYRNSGYGSETYSDLGNAIQNALKAQGKWAKEHPDVEAGEAAAKANLAPARLAPAPEPAATLQGAPDSAQAAPAAPGGPPTSNATPPSTEPAGPTATAAIQSESFPQALRGSLSSSTYRNDYFGFTLHVLSDWRIFDAAEIEAGEKQAAEAAAKKLQSVQQSSQDQSAEAEQPKLIRVAVPRIRHYLFAAALVEAANGGPPPTLAVWAVKPPPNVKATEDYFQSRKPQSQPGAEVVRELSPATVGGKTFLREDRRVSLSGGPIWTSELALFEKGYLWGFIIHASSKEALDESLGLLRSLISSSSTGD